MNKQVMKCYLEVLFPIHVGCDDVYEPTGFSVDENKGCLHAFDFIDFIKGLDGEDRTKFAILCQQGSLESIRDIYRFMQNRKVAGKPVALCEGFIEHYRRVLRMPENQLHNELNRFEIARTAYSSIDQRPYIPGSSVKGAFRTALLNKLAGAKQIKTSTGKNTGRQIEDELLNLTRVRPQDKVSQDPFRLVKISDFMPIGKTPTRVVYVVNKKKRPSEELARGPYQLLEVILPGAFFGGEIIVEKPQRTDAVSFTFDMRQLFADAGVFYNREKDREDAVLKQIGAGFARKPAVADTTLLRVGRHSGAECVTIEGHRQIKIMQSRGKRDLIKDHATTLWLISETQKPRHTDTLKPFGWASLGAITEDMFQSLDQIERNYSEKYNQTLTTETVSRPHAPEPEPVRDTPPEPESLPIEPIKEIWEESVITWNPGKGEVTASFQGKKAFVKGKDLVPESLRADLFEKKKKRATAKSVEVEPYGNAFKIVKISGES